MSIADNPTLKSYLGGIIVLLGNYANLPGNQDIRHLRLVPGYVIPYSGKHWRWKTLANL